MTDELLSAYLDGELTGDERSHVERLLAARPSDQQSLEEMRSLRADMQSLPRHRLDDDFAARVLDASRRERAGSSEDVERVASPRRGGRSSESARGGRPFVYAILALAAALLIMVSQRGRHQAPDAEVPLAGERAVGRVEDPGAMVSVGPDRANPDLAGPDQPGTDRPGSDHSAVPKHLASRGTGTSGEATVPSAPESAGGDHASGRPAVAARPAGVSDPPNGGLDAASDSPERVASATPRQDDPRQDVPRGADPAAAAAGNAHDMVAAADLIQYLFVVNVEVTPEGTRKHVFRRALRGHAIRFEDDLKVDDALKAALLASQMLAPAKPKATEPEAKPSAELVYVVATGEQIDSAVRHLATSGLVERLQFDVAIKPAQLQVFRRLRLADARDREQNSRAQAQLGRARRLLLDLAVLSPAVRDLAGQSLLTADPEEARGLLPKAPADVGDQQAPIGANQLFEVLFVVRRR